MRVISAIFGNPKRLITDRGTAFTSNEFEDFMNAEGIEHIKITTGVPRSNGQVERINRIIIPVITKLSIEEPSKWFKYIDRVQRSINSTYQRSIGTNPFKLLIGVSINQPEDLRLTELLNEEIIQNYNDERENLSSDARKQIRKIQAENKKTYNKKRKIPNAYKCGDLVAIKRTQFGPGLKFHSKYLGPYKVILAKEFERYDVQKVGASEGPKVTSTCAEYMKPWLTYCDNESSGSDECQDDRM